MWIAKLRLENFRSFESTDWLEFSRGINVLVGVNNAGKSSIIKGVQGLQYNVFSNKDIRSRAQSCLVKIKFSEVDVDYLYQNRYAELENSDAEVHINVTNGGVLFFGSPRDGFNRAENFRIHEPYNLIYPYLSRRKIPELETVISADAARAIETDLRHLVPRIDTINDRDHPSHELFREFCEEILGFTISTFPTDSGKMIGLRVGTDLVIPIDQMGEGTAQILGLLSIVMTAKNRVFLIEELENDLHPRALKILLRIISESAKTNQFIISTHSHIVTTLLGSCEDSAVFHVDFTVKDRMPLSNVRKVEDTADRMDVLRQLGYEVGDYSLWAAWLILEESSAETIVRQFLIPWFAPDLKAKLRTIAAGGTGEVKARFIDFHRLFLFIHLEEQYRNKAWVVVDGDKSGEEVVQSLQKTFSSWPPDHFVALPKQDFEDYLPLRFQEDVEKLKLVSDKLNLRQEKKALLQKVVEYAETNEEQAKLDFQFSFADWIDILRRIELAITSG